MINTGNRALIKEKKKRKLLIHSETIKGYATLYRFLLENEEITDELIDTHLSEQDKSIVSDLLPNIIRLCQDEWKGDESLLNPVVILDGNERIPCSLCGTGNKKIYYITNKISGKKMNVGSTCIDEFASDSLKDGKTRSQLEKGALRIYRLQKLNSAHPGIERRINTWDDHLNTFEILIPLKLENPYIELGRDIKRMFDDYLDERINESSFERFGVAFIAQSEKLQEMKKYCDENKESKFVVNSKIVQWIKKRKDDTTLQKLKETGFVSSVTVSKVYQSDFLKLIIREITPYLRQQKIKIEVINEDKEAFIISPFSDSDLKLNCTFENFLDYFCWVLFNEEPKPNKPRITVNNIMRVSRLYGRESFDITIFEMNRRLRRSNLVLEANDYDGKYDYFEQNVLDLKDKRRNQFLVLNLSEFLEEIKLFAHGVGNTTASDLEFYVKSLPIEKQRWYTKEQLKELRTTNMTRREKRKGKDKEEY